MTQRKGLIVALSFVAGVLAAALGGTVRSASADQPPRAAYFCFEAANVNDLQAKANAAGQRGWEMVSGVGHAGQSVWCFERKHAE